MDRMSEATYLYCLVRAPEKPSLAGAPPGLPGLSPLRALPAGDGLWLIAAGAPLSEYASEEIQRRLSDLSWVSDRALAHEAVIECFAAGGAAAVPMKLFTLFSSDERAAAFIREDRERLGRVLDRVEARVEWGVRVRLDDVRAREALAAEAQAGAGGRSAGTAFLLRKKLEQDASRELAGRLRSEMDAVFAELAEGASEAVRREPVAVPESGGLLLDAAFLVPRERSADFEAIVERCATRLAPRACDVTLTGPWPPYNFIAEAPSEIR
jgi:gas vesicle protein GvpL/GvpF